MRWSTLKRLFNELRGSTLTLTGTAESKSFSGLGGRPAGRAADVYGNVFHLARHMVLGKNLGILHTS